MGLKMNQILVLDLPFEFGEITGVIHPVVLRDEKNLVLIDCGYIGFLPAVEQALQERSLSCGDLTHVLITHHDHDHMGALFALKEKYPSIMVASGSTEAPYISGRCKSLRLEQAEAMQANLPEEQKAFGLAFCNLLKNVRPVPVDLEVEDGDVLDWCGGCTVVGTPGHTPGHISIYVNREKTLITGDAAALENGVLVLANPQYALDKKQAEASLAKIIHYGAGEVICYHGGVWRTPY